MFKKIHNSLKTLKAKTAVATLMMMVSPSVSFAADIGSVVDKATGYLQGDIAKSIGIAAIVIAGYLCIAKQMFPKMYFMMILIGLGLIFGASSLYTTFIG